MEQGQYKTWLDYYQDHKKMIAVGSISNEDKQIDYGESVYASTTLPAPAGSDYRAVRWLVHRFKKEYNVFVEYILSNDKTDKVLVKTFGWQQSAVKYAIEVLLICSGRLTRRGQLVHVG